MYSIWGWLRSYIDRRKSMWEFRSPVGLVNCPHAEWEIEAAIDVWDAAF